jgi:hypothetical protein
MTIQSQRGLVRPQPPCLDIPGAALIEAIPEAAQGWLFGCWISGQDGGADRHRPVAGGHERAVHTGAHVHFRVFSLVGYSHIMIPLSPTSDCLAASTLQKCWSGGVSTVELVLACP